MAFQSVKRSMDLETLDASGKLVLRFSQEPLWSKKEQDEFFLPRMPGAWKPDAEYQRAWDDFWRHYQIISIDAFSFFIGQVSNGVREYGLYGDEASESGQDSSKGHEPCCPLNTSCPLRDDDSCEDAEENDEDNKKSVTGDTLLKE